MTDFDTTPAEDRGSTGIFGQIGRVRGSAMGLLRSHIALLRAEIGDIVNQLKSMAALVGVALVFALLTGTLLYVGGFLFLGEWLFGSMGWGLAHGVLFGVAMIAVMVLGIVGAPMSRSAIAFVLAVLVTIGVALMAGLNIGYDTADYVAGQLAPPFDSAGIVALIGGEVIGAVVLMLLLMLVGGMGGALGGLILGLVLGGFLGWLLAGAPWTWPPAIGFAITVGLIVWPLLAVLLSWRAIDLEARFSRLYPRRSIETAEETKAWLEEQWQTRRPTSGS